MKIVVVGGGIVGVTTAYYLAADGYAVTLLEREQELATLASAGNAGLIAPGHSFAWASPSAPMELLRSLTVDDTALRVNPLKVPAMFGWGLRFLRECSDERAVKNTLVKLRLAQYSQTRLDELSAAEQIDYCDVHRGCLYIYRDRARFEAGVKKMKLLQDHGQKQSVLDADGVAQIEPVNEFVQRAGPGNMEAVFIRAPIIRRTGPGSKVLARYQGNPVLVEQDRHLVATFHPELTPDSRVHALFLEKL